MAMNLSPVEARILGSLIEKELTTPEYYPLTLNALLAACNQKNNRAPVMALDEDTLARGVCRLQDRQLIESFAGAHARALKYRQRLTGVLSLAADEVAVMCELLLRGAQTVGELRARAARMHPFATAEDVQAALDRLAARQPAAFVVELPRQAGHKETRFAHLLGETPPSAEAPPRDLPPPSAVAAAMDEAASLASLAKRVADLEAEVAAMKTLFESFKSQFE